jgi:hypothetical protein
LPLLVFCKGLIKTIDGIGLNVETELHDLF